MNIDTLIKGLGSDKEINGALTFLEQIISETDERLVPALAALIETPEKIENTAKFVTLLRFFSSDLLIEPLVAAVKKAVPETAPWLPHYLFALETVISTSEEPYSADTGFVDLLGGWIISGQGGLSWKSADVLSCIENPACHRYYVEGVKNVAIPREARVACLTGLINHHGEEERALYEELLLDNDPEFHTAVVNAIDWLDHKGGGGHSCGGNCSCGE